MSSYTPQQILPNEFLIDHLQYADTRKDLGTQGGKIMSISYNDQPLMLETTQLHVPYGADDNSKFTDSGAPKKYTVSVSFKDHQTMPKIASLMNVLHEIDNWAVQIGVQNSVAWFKRQCNEEVVTALYTNSIKQSRDPETGVIIDKYPPTLNLKIPVYNNKVSIPVMDTKKELITVEEQDILTWIPKGSTIKSIIKCNGVWFAGGKFGISWKLYTAQVCPPNKLNNTCYFKDNEDVINENTTETETNKISEKFCDSDSDEIINYT